MEVPGCVNDEDNEQTMNSVYIFFVPSKINTLTQINNAAAVIMKCNYDESKRNYKTLKTWDGD